MTAKSETVGVVAWQWQASGGVWLLCTDETVGDYRKFFEVRALVLQSDHESALAELQAELMNERQASQNLHTNLIGALGRLKDFEHKHERLLSGLEALAGEWERENFFGAGEQLRERIRALIPAAANTESEEES